MTSLLVHTGAHSTRPSCRPKTINQPLQRFLSLAVSWVKVVKNGKILNFQSQFSMSKIIRIFLNFFSLKNLNLGAHLLLLTFLKTSIFKPLYFLIWRLIFDDFYSTERETQKLFKRLVVGFGPKGMSGRMCDIVHYKWGHTYT